LCGPNSQSLQSSNKVVNLRGWATVSISVMGQRLAQKTKINMNAAKQLGDEPIFRKPNRSS